MRLILAALILMPGLANACECYVNGYYIIGYEKGQTDKTVLADENTAAIITAIPEAKFTEVAYIEPQAVTKEYKVISYDENAPLLMAAYTTPDNNAGWEKIIRDYKKRNTARKAGR